MLAARAGRRRADSPPPSVTAPSAIVIEVSTGRRRVRHAAPTAGAPIASTTKLMTALLTLERGRAQRHVYRAVRYRALPGRVADRAAAGRADDGRRPAARAADRVGQRRGGDARQARRRLRGAFVRAMNQRAQQLGLKNTHYANPIGLDDAGATTRPRATSCGSTLRAAHVNFFRRTVDARAGHAALRRPPAHVREPQRARRSCPLGQRRQDRPHAAGRLRAGRLRPAATAIQLISAVLGEPSVAARDADTLRAATPGRSRASSASAPRSGRTRCVDARDDPLPPRRRARRSWPGARSRRDRRPRGQRDLRQVRPCAVPDEVAGPIRSGEQARARSTSAAARRSVATRAAGRRGRRPGGRARAAHQGSRFTSPLDPAAGPRVVALAGTVGSPAPPAVRTAGAARAGSRRPHDHHRHAQHGHRQDARRCRTSGSAAATARSSRRRCRAARASTSRACSRRSAQPVIATGPRGRRDRHAHRRAAHAALGAVATSSASARSRAPTRR